MEPWVRANTHPTNLQEDTMVKEKKAKGDCQKCNGDGFVITDDGKIVCACIAGEPEE